MFLLLQRSHFVVHNPHTPDTSDVSAGWQLTINAFSPAEVQFDIAEREQ
jgi:hypothetical protein